MSTSTQERGIPPFTLGWRLRMALEQAKVSRSTMAAHCGVDVATITRWTHDNGAPPKRAHLLAWALATGVSREWLETGTAPIGPGPDGGTGEAVANLAASKRSSRRATSTEGYLAVSVAA